MEFLDLFLHVDDHLKEIIHNYQNWTYAILFLIIFIETGLVIWPFLPGDSLLFARGMLIAQGGTGLNIWAMIGILIVAAVFRRHGQLFHRQIFRQQNVVVESKGQAARKAQIHGADPCVLRKVRGVYRNRRPLFPIIRTFVPFVAASEA